jgi:undecaprenyl phosphate N,N'-diacetylbacillosamine 1-phosphate transferase
MYKTLFKPVFDRTVALIALILLSPLFVIVSLAIIFESGCPVFFLQERLGLNGKVFRIYKFRSMNKHMNVPVGSRKVFESDPRITKVGRFIRKTSIDELPQLFNILKGEMSFIGPRPPVTTYPRSYNEYSEFDRQRFSVRPGISGLAQIRHREINDWNINIPVDVEYVKNYGFLYDMKLFLMSLLVFFRTDNIYTKE